MPNRRSQNRGEGKIAAVIALIVLAAAVHVGMKFIPMRVAHGKLLDAVEDNATKFAAGLVKEDAVFDNILDRADELGIPLNEADLEVQQHSSVVSVKLWYEVDLEMVWGIWHHEFDVDQKMDTIDI
ncbi:MAG: hypothetical protein AAF533_22960 [Acidobacteriota bacterium]